MKKTVIENRWMRESDGQICKVFFHYVGKEKHPYVTFVGYNPFPFFNGMEKLYTSKTIFNEWMNNHGWKPLIKMTVEFSCVTIVK